MIGLPVLDKRQKTLLKQAKNCRDLAHFLRTSPRVKEHFSMHSFCDSVENPGASSSTIARTPDVLHVCKTTACAGGWAIYMGIVRTIEGLDKAFGINTIQEDNWIFGGIKRTAQREATVLETHASTLEARV